MLLRGGAARTWPRAMERLSPHEAESGISADATMSWKRLYIAEHLRLLPMTKQKSCCYCD